MFELDLWLILGFWCLSVTWMSLVWFFVCCVAIDKSCNWKVFLFPWINNVLKDIFLILCSFVLYHFLGNSSPTCLKYPKYERNEKEQKKNTSKGRSYFYHKRSLFYFSIYFPFIYHFLFINGTHTQRAMTIVVKVAIATTP